MRKYREHKRESRKDNEMRSPPTTAIEGLLYEIDGGSNSVQHRLGQGIISDSGKRKSCG